MGTSSNKKPINIFLSFVIGHSAAQVSSAHAQCLKNNVFRRFIEFISLKRFAGFMKIHLVVNWIFKIRRIHVNAVCISILYVL